MTPRWYDMAANELETGLISGILSDAEYRRGMRALNDELQEWKDEREWDAVEAGMGWN